MRNRAGLLVALGADNFGSGLFLPVVLLYVTRVVGVPLAVAGTAVAAGTVAGLAVPAAAGRWVDRIGPLRVVVCAELAQALAAVVYLVAGGALAVGIAAVLLAAGQQLFYSSLFALIADVAGDGPKDRPFAVAGMVRSACFALGGAAAGVLLSVAGTAGYRVAVIADAASFVACALVLALAVRIPRARHPESAGPGRQAGRLLADWPFLVLIVATGLIALPVDFFLSGMSVYALSVLHTRPWLPGAALAVSAGLNGAGATVVLRITRRLYRTTVLALASGLFVAWCAASAAALAVPAGWRPAELLAATVVMAVGGLLLSRVNALAEAAAPAAQRGRYLAAFQYAFTVPGVLAPAIVSLFSVTAWLPWLLVGCAASLAILLLRLLTARLPAGAVRAGSPSLAPRTPADNSKRRPSQAGA